MSKFSVAHILDNRSGYVVALTIFLRAADEIGEVFSGNHQISGTEKGKVILEDLRGLGQGDPQIRAKDTLVLLGPPADYETEEFEKLLIPYIYRQKGVRILITVENAYEEIEKRFSRRVIRVPLNESVLMRAREWGIEMHEVLRNF